VESWREKDTGARASHLMRDAGGAALVGGGWNVMAALKTQRLYCRRLRPVPINGKKEGRPCRSPRCSYQCRALWARRLAWCLLRSFRELPPTHAARVTATGLSDKEYTAALGRLRDRLVRRGIALCWVNEWSKGRRHYHLILRCPAPLTTAEFGELWRASLTKRKRTNFASSASVVSGSHYLDEVRDVVALAKYVVKDLKGRRVELPPASFKGRLFGATKGFLIRPLKQLWREQREEWFQ
jgi:hypothetical protein